MYDLTEVRADVDALWAVLRGQFVRLGIDDAPTKLTRPDDLHASYGEPGLLLSQTCGYPLVGALSGTVEVLGTFASMTVSPDGHYCSLIVVRPDARDRFERAAWPELTAAINGHWSLSGWISLLAATNGGPTWPGPWVVTGAHVSSLQALHDGSADVAAIDAVSYALLAEHRPQAVAGLDVVGEGPRIPCLPLVTAAAGDVPVPTVQAAIDAAVQRAAVDAELAASLRRQHIDRFVPLTANDYKPVAELVQSLGIESPPPWP